MDNYKSDFFNNDRQSRGKTDTATWRRLEIELGCPVAETEAVARSYGDAVDAQCRQLVDDVACGSHHHLVWAAVVQQQPSLFVHTRVASSRWDLSARYNNLHCVPKK